MQLSYVLGHTSVKLLSTGLCRVNTASCGKFLYCWRLTAWERSAKVRSFRFDVCGFDFPCCSSQFRDGRGVCCTPSKLIQERVLHMAIKFRGVDFIEFDTLLSDDE